MTHRLSSCLGLSLVCGALAWIAPPVAAQGEPFALETAAIMRADADFAQAVAARDRTRFLSFLAEATTFGGGTNGEVHGRDAVMKDWSGFFEAGGPTLSWTPTRAGVVGAGDLGFSTGRSVFRAKDASGGPVERLGEYLTVWRKQQDGSWRVVFDTGSTLPSTAGR